MKLVALGTVEISGVLVVYEGYKLINVFGTVLAHVQILNLRSLKGFVAAQAAAAYQQGHEVAKKCLGDQHPLTSPGSRSCWEFQ